MHTCRTCVFLHAKVNTINSSGGAGPATSPSLPCPSESAARTTWHTPIVVGGTHMEEEGVGAASRDTRMAEEGVGAASRRREGGGECGERLQSCRRAGGAMSRSAMGGGVNRIAAGGYQFKPLRGSSITFLRGPPMESPRGGYQLNLRAGHQSNRCAGAIK